MASPGSSMLRNYRNPSPCSAIKEDTRRESIEIPHLVVPVREAFWSDTIEIPLHFFHLPSVFNNSANLLLPNYRDPSSKMASPGRHLARNYRDPSPCSDIKEDTSRETIEIPLLVVPVLEAFWPETIEIPRRFSFLPSFFYSIELLPSKL